MIYSRLFVVLMRIVAAVALVIMIFKIKGVYDLTGEAPVVMSLATLFLLTFVLLIEEFGSECVRKVRNEK